MVHLSVAIAQFAQTLFWGITQAAGLALVAAAVGAIGLVIGWRAVRRRR